MQFGPNGDWYIRSANQAGKVILQDSGGNVGIGTTSPQAKLDVGGNINIAAQGILGSTGRLHIQSGSNEPLFLNPFANSVNIGGGGGPGNLAVVGRTTTAVLQITGGSDLSEQFEVRGLRKLAREAALEQVQPGMLVSIDSENPGKLIVSSRAYDRKVAGILSGAGGVNPGMLMGQSNSVANGAHPVALTGRVYAWVETSNGPIEPGDLLTTSTVPGHAMKVTDYVKAQGAIIGKAMTGLKQGRGLVLTLVTLQ